MSERYDKLSSSKDIYQGKTTSQLMNEDIKLFFPRPSSKNFPGMDSGEFARLGKKEKTALCEAFERNYEKTQENHKNWKPQEVFAAVWDSYEHKVRSDAVSSLSILALCQVIFWLHPLESVH